MMIIIGILVVILFAHAKADALPSSQLPSIIDNDLKVEVVYDGINFPTNMAFLGPNDILVLEKNEGKVQRVVDGVMLDSPLLDLPVSYKGERGLLGIAIQEKNENDNKSVFLYYTESRFQNDTYDQDPKRTVLSKYEFHNGKMSSGEYLWSSSINSSKKTGFHVGGEVIIGPDKNVYFSVGDMDKSLTESENEKGKPSDGTGVIYRITHEGDALDNNLLGENEPVNKFYAYGIRNSFGMDFDPISGKLWNTENGGGFGDEINLVDNGFNSGYAKFQGVWKKERINEKDVIGLNPEKELVNFNGNGKYSDPEFVWDNPVGPTGIKFLSSNKYGKEYQNDLFVGDVNNGNLYHFDLKENRTLLELSGALQDKIANVPEELKSITFGKGFGGITDIEVGPDGYLYILTISQLSPLTTALGEDKAKGTIYRIVSTDN